MKDNPDAWQPYLEEQGKIERREGQLWWLAIVIILCLTIAVGTMDLAGALGLAWSNPFEAFDSGAIRVTLIVGIFLICFYFRESALRLRSSNSGLLADIRSQAMLLQRRNRELSRLKDIADQLVGSLDMRGSLEVLLGAALDVTGAESASIILVDEETGSLDQLSAQTISASGELARASVKPSLAQMVIDRNEPLMMSSGTMSFHPGEHGGEGLETSTLLAPISLSGRVLGVLVVAGKGTGGDFAQHDLDAICTLTGQAGLALEKMQLYRKLQDQVVRLHGAVREMRQAQAGMVQSEKLATVGELAGGMAHEINNPLLTILGRAEMVLCDVDPASPRAKDLEIIKSETERIAGLVKNLLSFSRASSVGLLAMVDVNEVVEHTLELVSTREQSSNVEIIRRPSNGLPPVYAEKGELQQVFTNIIINAYQAMKKDGGRVIVETSQDDAGYVIAKIADTGPGIDPEAMGKIFEPFFTTKPEHEGTGLGLSVCKSIVEKYCGKIEVQNRPGEGATFVVKLPAAEEAAKDLAQAA